MKKYYSLPLVAAILFWSSCKNNNQPKTEVRNFPEIHITPGDPEAEEYRASITRRHDLIHMDLDVRFDWSKRYLYGKESVSLKPHFYPMKDVWLNARGMQINRVGLINGKDTLPLTFNHANDSLIIQMDCEYKGGEAFRLFIDYVARPDELKDIGGSQAINSDKGLYFINPDGKEKNKPRQIWTQGETQANSVWFPTIDAPNQKMTQEIKITIDNEFKTLSNGLMISSTVNTDGTRTDTWRQELPHSPYLVMMAIGPYSVVTDKWRDREVSYFVEKEYERVARKIFGNTPEMIEFFSKKMGVDYPWAKYSQVVVRDYVSGAMENTTATIHGEFLQQDERELLDGTNEDVVSHELFHHWFGDYVTCESWSNIPLNESFATYGEYLWNEHKYGREEADLGRLNDLNAYLRESKTKKVDLIRFYYDSKEDMFDRHSYQKGGCILHMLRYTIGDDAFFAGLKLYLENNKFKNVEVHQLRLAFEEVTGQDLNWFFNEWFLNKSHPVLDIKYKWDETSRIASVTVEQTQDLQESPLYRMPLAVDIYENGKARREKILLSKKAETFQFTCSAKPDFINFDADKILVGVKNENHTNEEWIAMYRTAPLFQDRFDALTAIAKEYKAGTPEAQIIRDGLKDRHWKIRQNAVAKIEPLCTGDERESTRKALMNIAINDPKSAVREEAVSALDANFKDEELIMFFQNATTDSSFDVCGTAFNALAARDKEAALKLAAKQEGSNHDRMNAILAGLYAKHGGDNQAVFMKKALDNSSGFSTYNRLQQYGKFLQRCTGKNNIENGIVDIYTTGKAAENWIVRLAAVQALAEYGNHAAEESKTAAKAGDTATSTLWEGYRAYAAKHLDELKKNETNEMLLKIYNSGK